MRKMNYPLIIIFFSLVFYTNLYSQVAINNNGSTANNNAILDINSTTKGFLLPRLTSTQIEAIASPPGGLIVFCTTDKKIYCFHEGDNEWKELDLGTSTLDPYAEYTIGTGGSCSNAIVGGVYQAGINLTAANTVLLEATFTTTGPWSIVSDTLNGYSFSGSGIISTTGVNSLILLASGTPTSAQTDSFTAIANNNGGNCLFEISVDDSPSYPQGSTNCITGGAVINDVFNPTTGEVWMDRNLGASQVATSGSDPDALGDLYQWGRLSDGHQCRTSSNTSTLSSTSIPGHSSFILSSATPFDWLSPQNDELWQGENGTNNPCPTGYRIPTVNEWNEERLSWTSPTSWGANDSELKLPNVGVRLYEDGTISGSGSYGYYWCSDTEGTLSRLLFFRPGAAYINTGLARGYGMAVRCIKNNPANYTIGSGGSCSNTTVNGSYKAGILLYFENTVTIEVDFQSIGQWVIYTDTVNGYSFSGTGAANSIGINEVTLTGSGTPILSQTDTFTAMSDVGTGSCSFNVTINSAPSYPSGSVHCISGGSDIHIVSNPITGKMWMDRNLGASQVADSSADVNAYGDLYQWGRLSDGHQCRTSGTTTTLSTTNEPGHDDFIITQASPYDWITPQNENLWQGVDGINNPCPEGYRLATQAEWNAEIATWSSEDSDGAFNSLLKLPVAGYRGYYGVSGEGTTAYYWTSSAWTGSWSSHYIWFNDSGLNSTGGVARVQGNSVRCIKD